MSLSGDPHWSLQNCEFKILTEDNVSIYVEKETLEKSPVFKNMLVHDMKESTAREITLGFTSNAMAKLITFLLNGVICANETYLEWEEMLRLSHYLQLDELFNLIACDIPDDAALHNVIQLAHIFGSTRLYDDSAAILKNIFNENNHMLRSIIINVETICSLGDTEYNCFRSSWLKLQPLLGHRYILLFMDSIHLNPLNNKEVTLARYLEDFDFNTDPRFIIHAASFPVFCHVGKILLHKCAEIGGIAKNTTFVRDNVDSLIAKISKCLKYFREKKKFIVL